MVPGRLVRAAAFGAAGFLAAAFPLGRLFPWPGDGLASVKLADFEAGKDDYTAVFVGDSRVYREIDPALFDQTLSGLGVESRSFNLGLLGMRLPEAYFVLSRVAAMRPKKLRAVFVGLRLQPFDPEPSWALDRRTLAWHEAPESLMEAAAILRQEERPRLPLVGSAAWSYAQNVLGRGRVPEFFMLRTVDREWIERRFGVAARRGYFPLELDDAPEQVRLHEEFLRSGRPEFDRRLKEWGSLAQPPEPGGGARPEFDRLRRLAAAQGWRIVFVRSILDPPMPTGCEPAASDCSVLDMSDLKRYPDLFHYERFYDQDHLRQDAGREFTSLLARRFAQSERLGAR